MPKSYRFLWVVHLLLVPALALFAQEQPKFKDVILDGKPAKLNINTGKIIRLVPKTSKDTVIDIKEKSNTKSTERFHKVKEGESLLDISKQYNISLSALKKRNGLETTLVKTGQLLRIDEDKAESIKALAAKDSIRVIEEEVASAHIVQKDETLYSISKRYGSTVDNLKKYNGLSSNLIRVGQRLLLIPNEEDSNSEKVNFVVIKKGDTLYSLAKRFNSTVNDLKQINGLNSNTILIGQKLRVK